jgi:hypothetical protein
VRAGARRVLGAGADAADAVHQRAEPRQVEHRVLDQRPHVAARRVIAADRVEEHRRVVRQAARVVGDQDAGAVGRHVLEPAHLGAEPLRCRGSRGPTPSGRWRSDRGRSRRPRRPGRASPGRASAATARAAAADGARRGGRPACGPRRAGARSRAGRGRRRRRSRRRAAPHRSRPRPARPRRRGRSRRRSTATRPRGGRSVGGAEVVGEGIGFVGGQGHRRWGRAVRRRSWRRRWRRPRGTRPRSRARMRLIENRAAKPSSRAARVPSATHTYNR